MQDPYFQPSSSPFESNYVCEATAAGYGPLNKFSDIKIKSPRFLFFAV